MWMPGPRPGRRWPTRTGSLVRRRRRCCWPAITGSTAAPSVGVWAPLRLTAVLLWIPRYLLPAADRDRHDRPMPEIRGVLRVLYAVIRLYCTLWHQLRSSGWAPLPQSGPAILIANHTCGIDHMLL